MWMRVTGSGDVVELESPIVNFLSDAEQESLVRGTGAVAVYLLLIVSDEHRRACEVLGQLRVDLARPPVSEGPNRYCWVIDFPLFDGMDDQGHLLAAHHPFTM